MVAVGIKGVAARAGGRVVGVGEPVESPGDGDAED
eukprot:CAMPEP_0206230446 /NCGR_PEP_ID=MMETSP0047_2-20121206/10266_1 /ASSEMBLY_ACC=CAM_ASM_000192 /TAXON_ID=195065 /ORGANISM="Chroomonas mesostigmatica_cf, Strain CCMP1168" /LENGTH=34 /DNA_ID= /DNA_START= /DNA_END= /DNA_ORIENTATION=